MNKSFLCDPIKTHAALITYVHKMRLINTTNEGLKDRYKQALLRLWALGYAGVFVGICMSITVVLQSIHRNGG